MRRDQFRAPMLGAVLRAVLTFLIGVSACAAQSLDQPESVSSADDMPSPGGSVDDLIDMDLDQLSNVDVLVPAMDTVVSTVSRQESTVGRSPAAVFVITPEMIRRSAANNIPDLLRMVPGLEVAQIDASQWAVSCRGFNGPFADKLLVQIDGRAIYSQMFSGVFWDGQDVPLEDIERIEVVRGPGATVWGSNAVNGVINIITKSAQDTQGLLVTGGTGTQYREFGTVRYGAKVGKDFAWRIYGKQFDRDLGSFPGEDQGFNDWRQARGGFRTDWEPGDSDVVTVQGDFYDGISGSFETQAITTPPFSRNLLHNNHISGENFLGRWTHTVDEDADWAFQAYYDHPVRDSPSIYDEMEIFDLDFQYHFLWEESHNVVCGAGYRHIDDAFLGTFGFSMDPAHRNTDLFSYFIQDEIRLEEDRWYLVAGSKFEHNDFSGFEFQPSVRLLFLPSERESMWAAISRAVRTPNRLNENSLIHGSTTPFAPVFLEIRGDESIAAEELLAYELGYRAQPNDDFSWDLALFYNDYSNLIGVVPQGPPFFDPSVGVIIPLAYANALSGDTYGAELASTYRVDPRWEVTGAYTLLYMDIHGPEGDVIQGSSPHNQVYLRSSWNLSDEWKLDLIGRYVDNLPALDIPAYLTGDVRLAWQPFESFEWAVVGRNLIDSPHQEFSNFVNPSGGSPVRAEIFTTLTWTY
jgi:iron complex outermembrane receptor protein